MIYWRPLAQIGPARPADALPLAGGPGWFTHVQKMTRDAAPEIVPARDLPADWRRRLTGARAEVLGLSLDRPRLMGILNVTPDSFSDGGRFATRDAARAQAEALCDAGADILDIGGESTRPGAAVVPAGDELARVTPALEAAAALGVPVSIDTRKAVVARSALAGGAGLVNDVSALAFDPAMAPLVASASVPVCLMHMRGEPGTMQRDPVYGNVLLDVYDWLEERVAHAEAAGIARSRIIIDPGIGFGKSVEHNLTLIRGLSLFHGLGCAVLLGASRKGFIGKLAGVARADARMPGSIAVALAGAAQGVQVLRVHDIAATAQALLLWRAVTEGEGR